MRRTDVKELHYITAIENVPSILHHGILSHKRVSKLAHKSVAMPEIQERRKQVTLPNGKSLHEYANLYLNARNKMMSKLTFTADLSKICVLRVSADVLDLPNTVICDRNASAKVPRFAPSPSGLEIVDAEIVFAESWKYPDDQIMEWRHGSLICAEVLVPDVVPNHHIIGAYVSCNAAERKLHAVAPTLPISINSHLFFQ